MSRQMKGGTGAVCCSLLLACFVPDDAGAHCDTLDGPVVAAGAEALETGELAGALVWVGSGSEEELTGVFESALAVRGLSPEARALADTYFFETLVRLHRASEGEPYTGLMPAGTADPAVEEADRALASGDAGELAEMLGEEVSGRALDLYGRVIELEAGAGGSLEAGRAYVEAYVEYVHFVEQVHMLAGSAGMDAREGSAHGH